MGLFQSIRQEAQRRELRFLIIGGLAVNFHGYARETADLDLLIGRHDRENWIELFSILAYTVYRDADTFIQLSPPHAGAWPVDLMLVREATLAPMLAAALEVEMYGVKQLIPTLDHLLALKLHALKHGPVERYLKDFLDVQNLVRINKVDLRSERIRQLFLKYGTLDLYEKISCASAGE